MPEFKAWCTQRLKEQEGTTMGGRTSGPSAGAFDICSMSAVWKRLCDTLWTGSRRLGSPMRSARRSPFASASGYYWGFMLLVLGCGSLPAAERVYPDSDWQLSSAADVGLDERLLQRAREYALTGEGSGYITRHGRLVVSWGDPEKQYDLKSTTKSFGATALGLAIGDGKVKLSDKAVTLHPTLGVPPESNRETGWIDDITIGHLAMQTAGFEKPGGYGKLLFEPGSQWLYSDAGPNWLAECLTLVYRRDMDELMFERVFTPIGITRKDLRWRRNQYRDHEIDGIMRREFGSGIHANVDAMARIGLLYLREGDWNGERIVPAKFVRMARTTIPKVVGLPVHERSESQTKASDHYGLLWWNNADGTIEDVPRDAYWSWGLYDSLIVVVPSLDIVVSRAGKSWERRQEWTAHYNVLKPFLQPIARSVAGE